MPRGVPELRNTWRVDITEGNKKYLPLPTSKDYDDFISEKSYLKESRRE